MNMVQGFVSVLLVRMEQVPAVAVLAIVGTLFFRLLVVPLMPRLFPRLWPTEPEHRQSVLTDFTFALLCPVAEVFSRLMTTFTIVACAILLGRALDPALLKGFGPVSHQPYWLVVIETLVVQDFIYYWTHRLAHRVPTLWKLHSIHHSTRHMNAKSAFRIHPFETWALMVNHTLLFALGFPLSATVVMAPFTTLYALFIHSKFRVRAGWVLNSPDFHRHHHSLEFTGDGRNFAGYFPIFDKLFGSYYFPKKSPASLGIDDPVPETWSMQLMYPLQQDRKDAAPAVNLSAEEQA
jgi:sterol desaturase/sphingolipid hydroxylase (fatty acid hydroxylase superfamily)